MSETVATKHSRTAHGEAQRQALAEAAFQLIADGGFERLRTRDVAAAASVNIATLHYYFATKEDLIGAVVDLLMEKFANMYAPSFVGDPANSLDQIRHELHEVPYEVEKVPGLFIVMFELHLRALRDPSIQSAILRLDEHWRAYIESILRPGVEQGVFRADLDITAATYAFTSFVRGFTMQNLVDRTGMPSQRIFAEIEQWLTGLKPTPSE